MSSSGSILETYGSLSVISWLIIRNLIPIIEALERLWHTFSPDPKKKTQRISIEEGAAF